jgi:dipeptidyl aminopeptidase/acylaminoacyl peptidase
MQKHISIMKYLNYIFLLLLITGTTFHDLNAQKRAMTLTDVMQFKSLSQHKISNDGKWIAAQAWPDRGDGFVVVKEARGRKEYTVELAKSPIFSSDSKWVAMSVTHPFVDLMKIEKSADRPKDGMSLINLNDGRSIDRTNVKSFEFTQSGSHLLIHYFEGINDSTSIELRKEAGTQLEVIDLSTLSSQSIQFISSVSTDSLSTRLVAFVADSSAMNNRLVSYSLSDLPVSYDVIDSDSAAVYSVFTWDDTNSEFYFIKSLQHEDGVKSSIHKWIPSSNSLSTLIESDTINREIPTRNRLDLDIDDNRLYFGVRSVSVESSKNEKSDDTFDFESILQGVELDVWHGDDPRIKTHEKIVYNQQKNQNYLSLIDLTSGKWIQLEDETLRNVTRPESGDFTLGYDDTPYLKEITWEGSASNDVYLVDLSNGERKKVMENTDARGQLSPDARYFVYFLDKNWHVMNMESGVHRNLTESLALPFFDEDHDSPSAPGGYGIAGWNSTSDFVFIYDKFDIWKFNVSSGDAIKVTPNGRLQTIQYRVVRTSEEERTLDSGKTYLISGYNDSLKNYGFFTIELGQNVLRESLLTSHRYRFVDKADNADVNMYTRESYDEFPDIWVANGKELNRSLKVTNFQSQLDPFAWGESQLVEWSSMDGKQAQGVLILPGNYKEGQEYPVIVYFYELFSQRLHEFNPQLVNHRPSFPFYASDGYAIFLPDVRYTEGLPGYSAIKYIVPGVQKIIDMGIADPDAIGIHGHSWSGYQAAHMVTLTDMFAAAVVGAPVGNMTSAYSGIRWGSGLARQFQYEKTQSRIGKTMWERLDLYIENSPVFKADRINTPMLIQFGDADEAVPWYQGIELYLALRRLDKDVVFLQYHGEPHHLQKYPNKLDYSIKMKQYFDHYLKGLPAASWITNGIPYSD